MNKMTPIMMLLLSSCALHKMEAPQEAKQESDKDYESEEPAPAPKEVARPNNVPNTARISIVCPTQPYIRSPNRG